MPRLFIEAARISGLPAPSERLLLGRPAEGPGDDAAAAAAAMAAPEPKALSFCAGERGGRETPVTAAALAGLAGEAAEARALIVAAGDCDAARLAVFCSVVAPEAAG